MANNGIAISKNYEQLLIYYFQIIHCDLAARNILISKGHTLKIADFGMAKELGEKEYHRRSPKDRIPVKWTAPEALESWAYSHKSDM